MTREHQDWPFDRLESLLAASIDIPVVQSPQVSSSTSNSTDRKKSRTLLKRHRKHHRSSDETATTSSNTSIYQHDRATNTERETYRSATINSTINDSAHNLAPARSETYRGGSSSLSNRTTTTGSSCGDFATAISPGGSNRRMSSGRGSSTITMATLDNNSDLQFHPADILSYSQTLGRQYSSSQAQLQSLTSPNFANNNDTLRKTPISQRDGFLSKHHKQQYRSQQSLVAAGPPLPPPPPPSVTTMPSVLNDPSSINSATNTTQQHQHLFASVQSASTARQHPHGVANQALSQRHIHILSASSHPVAVSNNNSQSLPPPYSATDAAQVTQMQHQQQIIATSSTDTQLSQNMSSPICQQPLGRPLTPFPNGGTQPATNGQHASTGRQARVPTSSSNQQVSAANLQQQQQQVMNYPINQVPPTTTTSNFPPINNQQYPAFVHYHQQRQVDTAASRCLQPYQQQPTIAGISKSKSCLACADISIKWYIVVIALLGLICALIGTIVGAVHSVGRDYISLALLLIGVGLVFIAISWIALRITINTYKSNRQGRQSSLRAQTQAQMSRLFANQSSGSLHRALLNERLCMMAAAAAMMQSHQQQQPPAAEANSAQQQPSGNGSSSARSTVVLDYIKRRLPCRLAHLLPGGRGTSTPNGIITRASADPTQQESATGNGISSGTDGQTPVNSSSTSWSRRPPGERSQLSAGQQQNSQQQQHHHQQQQAVMAAMLLQHYQQQQCQPPPLMAPHGLLGAPFLFSQPPHPPPPPPLQLFGLATAAAGLMDYSYRPPPPSYNASMQDLRVRALMQQHQQLSDRTNGNIMHWQATNPIYMPGAQHHQSQQTQTHTQIQSQTQLPADGTATGHVEAPVHQPTATAPSQQNEGQTTESAEPSIGQQQCQPTTIVIESQQYLQTRGNVVAKTTETGSGPTSGLQRAPSTSAAENDCSSTNRSAAASLKSSSSTQSSITGDDKPQSNSNGSTTVVNIGQSNSTRQGAQSICQVKTLGYL